MRIISKTIAISLLLVTAMAFTSCRKKTTGDIHVTVTILAGQTLDLTGINVQLHGTSLFDNLIVSQAASGTATTATATFSDIEEGKYYLCAWNDKDGNLEYSTGDIVAWYPYSINLLAKDELDLTIEAYVED